MDKICIQPQTEFYRIMETAPDKSITHRAILFNAVAKGTATVSNALLGEDCRASAECVRRLGASVSIDGDRVTVSGASRLKSADLYVGNSGTTMRLMSGLLAGIDGCRFTLDGDGSIRNRPMRRVIDPLRQMGAKIDSRDGKAPLTVTGAPLSGIDYRMPVASAQVKSAILLAGLAADGVTSVFEKEKTRDHTERMLALLGADLTGQNNTVTVRKSTLTAKSIIVPGDISSAAYPLVLAACAKNARVTVKNVGVNPTRTGIFEVFDRCGVKYELSQNKNSDADNGNPTGEPSADVTVWGGAVKPFCITGDMMPRLVDEIPVLAVLACFAEGESVISGAQELKVKESNRIDTTVKLLKAFGATVEATDDGMRIFGKGYLVGDCEIDPEGDHRIAMSAAVAAALSRKGATVHSPDCAAVSYPGFFEIFH